MGPEIWIVAGLVVLLFGGSQLPKLARSLGEAKKEFEGGQKDGATPTPATPETKITEAKVVETKPDDDTA
jgi:sec-independent protein translocase protein TatA